MSVYYLPVNNKRYDCKHEVTDDIGANNDDIAIKRLFALYSKYKNVHYIDVSVAALKDIALDINGIHLLFTNASFSRFWFEQLVNDDYEFNKFKDWLNENYKGLDYFNTLAPIIIRIKSDLSAIKSVQDCVAGNSLTRPITISVLLHDQVGNYIFSKRNKKYELGKPAYGISCTAAIMSDSLDDDDPVIAESKKAIKRKLKFVDVDKLVDLKFYGIAVGHEKKKPVAIVTGCVHGVLTKEDINDDDLILVNIVEDKSALINFEHINEMSEVAQFHLKSETDWYLSSDLAF